MHILVIVSWYKTPENPIIGTFLEEHARMLKNKGYKVGILYPSFNANFSLKTALTQFVKKNQPQDFIDKGIPTLYSYANALFPSRFQHLNNWFICFATYLKYKKYLKKYGKPDVIHADSVFLGAWVARYISKKQHLQYVLKEHTNSILYSKWITTDKVTRDLVKKTISDAKTVVLASNFIKQCLIEKYQISSNNVKIIPYLVNPIFYATFFKKEKFNSFVLLCIGSLEKRKQQKLLFDALVIILRKGYDITLNLIGDGDDRTELISYANEKNIQHLIKFKGNQSRNVVKQEIDKSHLIVSASKIETFGISVIEAFACGRPVVAIDSGGPRDTITPENGILVKENTPEKLAEAIISVMNNYENYDQEKIIADCIKKYSENAVLAMLEPIYKEAVIKP